MVMANMVGYNIKCSKNPLCVCNNSKNNANPRAIQIALTLKNRNSSRTGTNIKIVSSTGAKSIANNQLL